MLVNSLAVIIKNRRLISTMVKREVLSRYRGSVLGLLWSFFNPVFMLVVYTFVFSVVFKSRWVGGTDSKTEFALILFAGLLVFNFFAECIGRAPSLIVTNVNYVKKVVFPIEILPVVSIGSALFHMVISLFVWMSFYNVFFGVLHWTVVLLPLIILPLVLFVLGFSWFLSSLGVYLRDVNQVVGVIITMLMFLSPIFFPVEALPSAYQKLLVINPLTTIIEMTRQVLFWGTVPSVTSYLMILLVSFVICTLGLTWFKKTQKGFADVI